MTRGIVITAALAAALAFAPAAAAQDDCGAPSRSACRGVEKLAERGAAECRRAMYAGQADPDSCPALPAGRRVSQQAIAEYEKSWLHKTLAFQHDLGNDVAFRDAPWLGTHNSFNDPNEDPTLSHTDSNQQLTLRDQLRVDMRSLELDVHWLPSPRAAGPAAVLCHGQGQYAGCTTERLLSERLPEIRGWLEEHPKQMLLLYIQDEIYEAAGYAKVVAELRAGLGEHRIYKPQGESCQLLPLDLTRAKVLKSGAQVVIVSSCSSGPSLAPVAFNWPGSVRFESRPFGFGASGCDNDGAPVPYASHLVRMYEDSTWLSVTAERTGQTRADDELTPDTVQRMLLCGVDLVGFDQILPDDGRLAASAWSWDAGQPSKAGDCAVLAAGNRWRSSECQPKLPVACRSATGEWRVLDGADKPGFSVKLPAWFGKDGKKGKGKNRKNRKVRSSRAERDERAGRKKKAALKKKGKGRFDPLAWVGWQCAKGNDGLQFAAPRSASENAALAAVADGREVLIGLRRKGAHHFALDKR